MVPERLRTAGNESVYKPKVVSIRPIHHGRKGLEAIEEYKQRFLNDFLERTTLRLDMYRFVKDRETKLKSAT